MRRPTPALALAGWLVSCGGPDPGAATTFGIGSGPGGLPESTGAESPATSTGGEHSTGPVAEGSSTGEPGEGGTTEPLRDVGGADLGSLQPAGCKGKIDFLFVLSRSGFMESMHARLIEAFAHFIAAVEVKFADFDYHIMVVDGDAVWGSPACALDCPAHDCKVGEPCCPLMAGCHGDECIYPGDPCCTVDDYPCDLLQTVTVCDETMGAGTVFPAGELATNAPCDIAGGRRYITPEQPDLAAAFACVAQIGVSGGDRLADAMVAALSPELNGPGGCNEGFLRDDALLMVTFASNTPDSDSTGKPKLWAEAVLAAKHGDPNAVVMFSVQEPECNPHDMICDLVKYYFPHWYIGDNDDPDYRPAFDIATDRVMAACSQFIPQ